MPSAWHKMVHIFHFLKTGMGFEIANPFSWIFKAISSEKSCLISMPFLYMYNFYVVFVLLKLGDVHLELLHVPEIHVHVDIHVCSWQQPEDIIIPIIIYVL